MQQKLTVGAADNPYEQEADRVAYQVLNMPEAVATDSMQRAMSPEEDQEQKIQTKPLATSIAPIVQRQMGKDDEEDKPIQTKLSVSQPNDPSELNARVCTTGQDMFLTQGEYNPSSRAGQGLLAHELTHVVQQDGDQPQRARTLLGMQQGQGNAYVSRLVDAASAAPVLARRSTATAMEERADKAELERAEAQQRGPTSDIAKLSVVADVADAERLRKHLVSKREDWDNALEWKREGEDERGNAATVVVDEKQREQNEVVISKLDDYVANAQEQRGGLQDFKAQLAYLERDHERLIAQIVAYANTDQGGRTLESDDTAIIGAREVASAGIKPGEFSSVITSPKSATATGHQEAAEQWRAKMTTASREVGTYHTGFRGQLHTARASSADLEAVLAQHRREDKQAEIDEKSAPASGVQDTLTLIGDLVGNIVGLTGWLPEGAKGDSRSAGVGAAKSGALLLLKLLDQEPAKQLEKEIGKLKDQLGRIKNEQRRAEYTAAFNRLEAAKIELLKQGQLFIDAHKALGEAQNQYRRSMWQMGASADVVQGRGDRFEVIAQILAEADAYLARSDATIAIGRNEMAVGRATSRTAAQFDISGDKPGVEYYELVIRYKPGKRVEVSFYTNWVSVRRYGFDVADTTVEKGVKQLELHGKNVKAHADQLRKAFESRKP
jgi:hypothetical protein